MIGKTISHYRIIEKLGGGGMGVVYKARDLRLDRFVCIKVLHAQQLKDESRKQRFVQEAKSASSLNHPNIITIYEIDQADGTDFIVMEFVAGKTLQQLIPSSGLPVTDVLKYAIPIASALAAANAAGIVHRDIKPGNIMVGANGIVKVLDFGLAKLTEMAPSEFGETATLRAAEGPSTEEGTIVGTTAYMSPEQAEGKKVDARSDIFSFGSVLYEMVTGRRAFRGDSKLSTLSAILKEEPKQLSSILPDVPRDLEKIISRCLRKDPERRFQHMADLKVALEELKEESNSGKLTPAPALRTRGRKWLALGLSAVFPLLAAIAVAGWFSWHSNPEKPEFERLTFRQGHVSAAHFTSDGQNVIYTANWDNGPGRTYLATPGNPESRDLMMPENSQLLAALPAGDLALLVGPFDPDGSGTLARNSLTGGQTRELLEHVMAADWTTDGRTGAITRRVDGVWRLEFPEGNVTWKSQWPAYGLRISPDGQRVAFCVYDQGSRAGIMTLDRAGTRKYIGVVSSQNSQAQSARLFWSPDGREIWFRSLDANDPGTIYSLSLSGKLHVIARFPGEVTLHDLSRRGQALITTDAARAGILGVAPGETVERDLSVLDASELSNISQDGNMIVTNAVGASGGPHGSVYLRRTDGAPPVRLGEGRAFAFSPDGKWLTGITAEDAVSRKFVLLPTGTGEETVVSVAGLDNGSIAGWLPQEQNYLVEGHATGKQGWQVFVWDALHGSLRTVSPENMSGEGMPMLSPDGRRYYHRGPDSAWHVYSVADGSQSEMRGLTAHDVPSGWRADSRSIYVRMHADTNKTIRVGVLDVNTGERKLWKEIHPQRPVDEVFNLAITPDGRAYAYNYSQATSDLYLVRGLK